MDPSKANPREYLRQAIDSEIKSESLGESIRALRHRRNALAPVSSLPTEVITAIFFFLLLPGTSPQGGKLDHHLVSLLRVPMSVVNGARLHSIYPPSGVTSISPPSVPAGATEILARARMAPLYLEAWVPIYRWDGARFIAFQRELQTHVSHICHLSISAEPFHLRKILEGLISPAPTLEYLSLSNKKFRPRTQSRVSVPDTLFDGTTPRLSCLSLCNYDIGWKSPLLKGLKNLEILTPSTSARPNLAVWLDALDEMPQLETLVLHSASPTASSRFDVERTVTLPFLTHLDISAEEWECALALAHLVLPALTSLCLIVNSSLPHGDDVRRVLPTTQPLQSMFIRGERTRVDIFAWPVPDIDDVQDPPTLLAQTRVTLSVTSRDWFRPDTYIGILDAALTTLPLDSLVTLTAQNPTRLDKQIWRRHASREMLLLQDNGGREFPLLPSLTRIDLIDTALSARRTLRLCDALMKRVEQGVPLEALDLSTCAVTDHAIRLLSEIVVDVLGPAETLQTMGPVSFTRDSAARGPFVHDDDSGAEDHSDDDDEDDTYTSDDDEEGDEEEIDEEEEEDDEESQVAEKPSLKPVAELRKFAVTEVSITKPSGSFRPITTRPPRTRSLGRPKGRQSRPPHRQRGPRRHAYPRAPTLGRAVRSLRTSSRTSHTSPRSLPSPPGPRTEVAAVSTTSCEGSSSTPSQPLRRTAGFPFDGNLERRYS
ncbi:hypothetical protein BJY52DRAFT_1418219 [Lactarius psammicola]|nr:hypothetical protein BJY52DRAFT_1418219 [Lactarius psammicola]